MSGAEETLEGRRELSEVRGEASSWNVSTTVSSTTEMCVEVYCEDDVGCDYGPRI